MKINNNVLISIIIPVYNVEQYLSDCILSVLNQTYGNIEVILIDDGSTDSSGIICDNFAKKDERVSIYHIKNGGVSKARNLGIKKARGKYIQFVDSDDTVEPNMVEDLLKNLIETNSDLSICGYTKVKRSGLVDVTPREGVYEFNDFINFMKYWLIDPIIGSPCNKLFQRKIILDNEIEYEPNICYAEDYLFNIRYLANINRISVLANCYYKYNHLVEGSLHQINFRDMDKNWEVSLLIVNTLKNTLAKHNVNDEVFINYIYLYFLTSNSINRLSGYSKAKCIEWIKDKDKLRTDNIRFMIFPRYPRVSISAILVWNILNNKYVNISYLILKLLYMI